MQNKVPNVKMYETQVPFCSPFLLNSTQNNTTLWSQIPIECRCNLHVFTLFLALLCLLTSASNVAVLVTSLSKSTRRARRRNPTMLNYSNYVISMAIADLLMGILVIPLTVTSMFEENDIRVVGVVTHVSIFASLYTIAAASIDRFITSSHPFTSVTISRFING